MRGVTSFNICWRDGDEELTEEEVAAINMILRILEQQRGELASVSMPKVNLTDIDSTYNPFFKAALLASEWALRFGGEEGVTNVLRRRGDVNGDQLAGWGILGWGIEGELEEGLDELPWRLAERVFIQPAPGSLKIS